MIAANSGERHQRPQVFGAVFDNSPQRLPICPICAQHGSACKAAQAAPDNADIELSATLHVAVCGLLLLSVVLPSLLPWGVAKALI
jgi:hypothetical protein